MKTEKPISKIDLNNLAETFPTQHKIETISSPEKSSETNFESVEKKELPKIDKKIEVLEVDDNIANTSTEVTSTKQARALAIDKILSEGLHEIFLNMDPSHQEEFKKVGEETTIEISTLLDKAKVKVGKIINLIKKWLKIIPGVNKFFLEQEAKIKADSIIKIKNNY